MADDRLSAGQVAALAHNSGFRGTSLVVAVAVAKAESGFRPKILGDTTITTAKWGPSIGLWQIRSLKKQEGTGLERDASRLIDPEFNAQSAFSISSHGDNFKPWSTFTNGAYKHHLGEAQLAVDQLGDDEGTIARLRGSVSPLVPEDDLLSALSDQEQRELLDLLRKLEKRSKATFDDISGEGRLKEAVLAARWLLGTGVNQAVTLTAAGGGESRDQLKTLVQGAVLDGIRKPSSDRPDRGALREPLLDLLREAMDDAPIG